MNRIFLMGPAVPLLTPFGAAAAGADIGVGAAPGQINGGFSHADHLAALAGQPTKTGPSLMNHSLVRFMAPTAVIIEQSTDIAGVKTTLLHMIEEAFKCAEGYTERLETIVFHLAGLKAPRHLVPAHHQDNYLIETLVHLNINQKPEALNKFIAAFNFLVRNQPLEANSPVLRAEDSALRQVVEAAEKIYAYAVRDNNVNQLQSALANNFTIPYGHQAKNIRTQILYDFLTLLIYAPHKLNDFLLQIKDQMQNQDVSRVVDALIQSRNKNQNADRVERENSIYWLAETMSKYGDQYLAAVNKLLSVTQISPTNDTGTDKTNHFIDNITKLADEDLKKLLIALIEFEMKPEARLHLESLYKGIFKEDAPKVQDTIEANSFSLLNIRNAIRTFVEACQQHGAAGLLTKNEKRHLAIDVKILASLPVLSSDKRQLESDLDILARTYQNTAALKKWLLSHMTRQRLIAEDQTMNKIEEALFNFYKTFFHRE